MVMSGETDRDALPGALEGGIPFVAVALSIEMINPQESRKEPAEEGPGQL